jgi:hypothetical protein
MSPRWASEIALRSASAFSPYSALIRCYHQCWSQASSNMWQVCREQHTLSPVEDCGKCCDMFVSIPEWWTGRSWETRKGISPVTFPTATIWKFFSSRFVQVRILDNAQLEKPKNAVFWDITPCGSCKNWRFGGTQCFRHQFDKNRWPRNDISRN